MKNGQRIPADQVRMGRLIDALNLSPYEQEVLWQEYHRARYGDEAYRLQEQIAAFIESFTGIPGMAIQSEYKHIIPEVKCVDNRLDLEYLVKAVIENEALRENGSLKMVMQSDFDFIYNLLPCIYRNSKKLAIEHIICLEGSHSPGTEPLIYNLKFFQKIIPVLLSENSGQYNVYYYYDQVSSHFSSSVLMPYVIITSAYVINISVDLCHALVSEDAEVIELYQRLYVSGKRACKPLVKKMDERNIAGYSAGDGEEIHGEKICTIGGQPCFGLLDIESMLSKYIKSDYREIGAILESAVKANRHLLSYGNTVSVASYFTRRGMERLMKEGIAEEIPSEICHPLEPKDRQLLVKKLILAIKAGWYKAYLLNEEKIHYPKELIITAKHMSNVQIFYMSDETDCRFVLQEQSLSKMIYEFLEGLDKTTFVLSEEDTLKYLETLTEPALNG